MFPSCSTQCISLTATSGIVVSEFGFNPFMESAKVLSNFREHS
jgi:hypothetical protein